MACVEIPDNLFSDIPDCKLSPFSPCYWPPSGGRPVTRRRLFGAAEPRVAFTAFRYPGLLPFVPFRDFDVARVCDSQQYGQPEDSRINSRRLEFRHCCGSQTHAPFVFSRGSHISRLNCFESAATPLCRRIPRRFALDVLSPELVTRRYAFCCCIGA